MHAYFDFNCVVAFIVISGYCIARSSILDRRFGVMSYALRSALKNISALIACALFAGAVELMVFNSAFRPAVWTEGFDLQAFQFAVIGMSGYTRQFASYAPSYTVSWELLYYAIWGAT